MSTADSSDPRVYVPADKEDVLTFLQEEGPFDTRAAALASPAALGYREGRRVLFEKWDKDVRWGIFREEGKAFLADLFSAADSDEIAIMRDERGPERRQLFSEYANGGLALLRELVMDKPRTAEDVILELVLAAEAPGDASRTDSLGALAAQLEAEPAFRPAAGQGWERRRTLER